MLFENVNIVVKKLLAFSVEILHNLVLYQTSDVIRIDHLFLILLKSYIYGSNSRLKNRHEQTGYNRSRKHSYHVDAYCC